ncbi:MAG TPA: nitrilase-related carbon-nitrogen hydrolase, partial [Candidatus Baltobacteraceae bacterium]|nr:nitrilase-related carbon-nitrogen hydrolase [Candidatus Baltobacteraceae bacterium]
MKIAAVQINVTPGDITKNVEKLTRYIDEASNSGNDLVIFPEMSDVGYDMPIIVKTASSWDDEGSPVRILQQKALRRNINIVAGVSERVKEDVYNALVVINRQGRIVSKYRKTHLITAEPMLEHHHLKAGDKLVTCKIDDVEVGLMTCYDIRFPEVARSLSISGAKLLLVPAAFPLVRLPHWTALNIARAIENQ